jgi:hypothetical protein
MFAGVVDMFVAIYFSPRLLIAWMRYEIEQRTPMDLSETRPSWRDLEVEVKARLGSVSEAKDELQA